MIPKWIEEASKEIDYIYGDFDISERVAEIIWDKYKNSRQRIRLTKICWAKFLDKLSSAFRR